MAHVGLCSYNPAVDQWAKYLKAKGKGLGCQGSGCFMEVACVEVAEAVVAQSYIGEEDAEDDSVEQVEDDVKD